MTMNILISDLLIAGDHIRAEAGNDPILESDLQDARLLVNTYKDTGISNDADDTSERAILLRHLDMAVREIDRLKSLEKNYKAYLRSLKRLMVSVGRILRNSDATVDDF